MASSLRSPQKLVVFLLVAAPFQVHSAHAQDVEQQMATCGACHPTSNVPANSVNPIIWGQNAGYVYLQLRDFKLATRASESDAAMHALTQTMTDAQMLAIAKYVAAQPWPKSQDKTAPPTDALYMRGAQLMAYGDCGACHFNNWQGYSATPRLRGQTPSYLTTTINEFRDGKRGNSPGMADLLRAYSDDDIKAMVAYLSSVD
jgi:cytochrome c553